MLHKIAAIALGLLCLAPAYALLNARTAPGKFSWADVATVAFLAVCGLGLFASTILE